MVPILSGIIAGHGSQRDDDARVHAVADLRAGHGLSPTRWPASRWRPRAVMCRHMFQQTWIIVLFAGAVRGAGAVDAGAFHPADARGDPDAAQRSQQPADRRQLRRRGGDGRAVGADRHDLRGAAAGRHASRSSARAATWCAAPAALFATEPRAWARRCWWWAPRQGKLLPRAGPWMDTVKQLFGVDDAGRRRLDAGTRDLAGTRARAVGRSRCRDRRHTVARRA
jgi:hypothetical protein